MRLLASIRSQTDTLDVTRIFLSFCFLSFFFFYPFLSSKAFLQEICSIPITLSLSLAPISPHYSIFFLFLLSFTKAFRFDAFVRTRLKIPFENSDSLNVYIYVATLFVLYFSFFFYFCCFVLISIFVNKFCIFSVIIFVLYYFVTKSVP